MKYAVGDKVKFKSEVQRYTIRACNDRFIIATKPYNPQRTFIYTIIDLVEQERAGDNYYCRYTYTDESDAQEAINDLMKTVKMREEYAKEGIICCDGFWLSGRSCMPLDLERIDN